MRMKFLDYNLDNLPLYQINFCSHIREGVGSGLDGPIKRGKLEQV